MNPGSSPVRVVLDTNVLFSAVALPKDSQPARILELARSGEIEAVASAFILGELERNLARKAGWDDERIRALRRKLRAFAVVLEPRSRIRVVKASEADNRVLACALDAKAAALITGNMKHLRPLGEFHGIMIRTPREFLDQRFPGELPAFH